MRGLSRRLARMEENTYRIAQIKSFMEEITSIVAKADADAGREVERILIAGEAEFLRNTESLVTTIGDFIKKLRKGPREMILRDIEKRGNVGQTRESDRR